MTTTLITVLGKGRDNIQTGYREATYQFSATEQHKTAYFGLALAEHLQPDTLIMLGTAGSMWGVLVENHAIEDEDEELRLELMEAETQADVTQALLDKVTALLTRGIERKIILRLIPSGKDEKEQIEILDVIAATIGKSQNALHFDLTHGYRHLGMIGFLSSFMLERLRKQVNVAGLWYGALDMTTAGITPVLRLDGLNAVQKWVSALDKFNANGDYGVFSALLAADGFPQYDAVKLQKAAFAELTTNISDAANHLKQVLEKLDAVQLTGASALFQEALRQKLLWARLETLSKKQRQLALNAHERGDLLRAVILGSESLISRRCEQEQVNPLDYAVRERVENEFRINLNQLDWNDNRRQNYWTLKHIRNAMAHGTRPAEDIRELLNNREQLVNRLRNILDQLVNI